MDVMTLGGPSGFSAGSTHYSVKVRSTTYLWGSAGLTRNLTFTRPFVIHMQNDVAGEPVTIGTRLAAGTKTDLGILQAGEFLSVSIDAISGLYAECTLDSVVHCLIHH